METVQQAFDDRTWEMQVLLSGLHKVFSSWLFGNHFGGAKTKFSVVETVSPSASFMILTRKLLI